MNEFDNWYNGLVGFQINSERMYDELCVDNVSTEILRKWMKSCWNAAIETSSEHIRYMNVEFIDDVADDILTLKIS